MRCRRCGGELGLDGRCEDCGALAAEVLTEREDPGAAYEEVPVHVMTDRERISYRGVTIEEGEPERPDVRFERSRRGWSGMIYTTPGDSWQSKLILYAGGALRLFRRAAHGGGVRHFRRAVVVRLSFASLRNEKGTVP